MRRFLAAAVFLTGCVGIPRQPQYRDPYAVLKEDAAPVFAGLSGALIVSENSKQALEFGRQGGALAGFDADALFEDSLLRLKSQFKTLVKVDTMAEARARGADVIMVSDTFVQARRQFRIDRSLLFLAPDGRELDKISSSAERAIGFNGGAAVMAASDESLKRLQEGLRASSKLAQFAASVAAKIPAVPAAKAKVYSSEVDRPAYRRAEAPEAYALIVGIDKYAGLPPADFAERDAAAVREHARALGVPDRNVVYLTGSSAGKASLEKYLESWLPERLTEKSSLLVYFSGHGAPDVKTATSYLVPWDGDPRFLQNTAYPVSRLYQKLNALKARNIVVALDACFSGAGGRSVLPKGARPLLTKVDVGEGAAGRLSVLAASSSEEIAGSEESQGHGVFTYELLRALEKRAGRASARQLYDDLKPKVQDAARRDNRDQTPQLLGAADARLGD